MVNGARVRVTEGIVEAGGRETGRQTARTGTRGAPAAPRPAGLLSAEAITGPSGVPVFAWAAAPRHPFGRPCHRDPLRRDEPNPWTPMRWPGS